MSKELTILSLMKEKELEVIKFLHPNLFDNDYPGLDLEAFDDLNLAHKKACLSVNMLYLVL